jgi:hypothetical protein
LSYANADDVLTRLGRGLTDEELTLVETRLADAERLIRRTITDMDARVDAGTIDAEDVKQVEAQMVLRLVRNPEGVYQETDGNYSYMLSRELASGKLEVLPEEWEILGVRRLGMFVLYPEVAPVAPPVPFGSGG